MSRKIRLLREDVEEHGEVHAVVAEHEDEVEIRQGTASIGEEVIRLDNGRTTLTIDADEIVSWYKPVEFYHEH